MSYTTQQFAEAINKKGRQPKTVYPYTLESPTYRWVITNEKHAPVIYVAQAENGLYKIGRASNVVSRIAAMDAASPIPICFHHLIMTNNAYDLERELHQKIADCWVRGEWFRLGSNELNALTSLNYVEYEIERYPADYELRDLRAWKYGEIRIEQK